MSRRTRFACFALASLVVRSNAARAQESHVYVEAAAIRSFQGEGQIPDAPDTPKPGLSGDAFGIFGAIGVPLHPRVNIALEVSWPSRFDAQQSIAYHSFIENYRNAHRDLIVSGVFHYRVARAERVSPELVGGFSVVNEDTVRRTSTLISRPFVDPPVYGPYGPEIDFSRITLGVVVGVDVPVRLVSRISLVPGVRIHIIQRSGVPGSLSDGLHLDPFVWRGALGLRVHF